MAAVASFGACLQQRLVGLKERLRRLSRDGGSADAFLLKATTTLENLKHLSKGAGDNCTIPASLLQLYTQAVLDITYFEENQLVDEDFLEESCLQKVEELISALSEPENLIKESGTSQEPLATLGIELLECLYWRRGALLYMFCHAVKERKEWLAENKDSLEKFLKEGIHYLVKMLGFRCSDNSKKEFLFQDSDASRLLCDGIFSDTHLLAMMYSGEMCYWGLNYLEEGKHQKQSTDSKSQCIFHGQVLNFRDIGEKMLLKYVAACEGPLRGHDWNTSNAKFILDYFKQLST